MIVLAIAMGGLALFFAWEMRDQRRKVTAERARADLAMAELVSVRRHLERALARGTHAEDQRDAAAADRTALIDQVTAVADSLDQGAHKFAARRIRAVLPKTDATSTARSDT